MNEDLQQALMTLVDDIKSAKDFAIDQAPEVVQQMVAYDATMAWIGSFVGLLFLVAGIAAGAVAFKSKRDEVQVPSFFVCLIILCISTFTLSANIPVAIQATFYPKWFIVEKIMHMIG